MTARGLRQRGFTLIELMVVVAIVGLLAGVAVVQVHGTMRRTKEARLHHDLRVMRDLIQQYKVDKKKYPEALTTLVEAGYLRVLPVDPITESSDSWIEVFDDPFANDTLELSFDKPTPTGFSDAGEVDEEDTGLRDVLSGAPGTDSEGVPFEEY